MHTEWELRDPDIVWLYVWFLGSFGGHDFLLRRQVAWLKLIFCWTGIPAIVALVQLFTIRNWVRENNSRWAESSGLPPETFVALSNWFAGQLIRVPSRAAAPAPSLSQPPPQ